MIFGYRFNLVVIVVWFFWILIGVLHGGREAYHAQPTVFETRFGVAETSFFGSKQWHRQYEDDDPAQPHRVNFFNPLRDYWHFAGTASTWILIAGAGFIFTRNQQLKWKIVNIVFALCFYSLAANLFYNWLR